MKQITGQQSSIVSTFTPENTSANALEAYNNDIRTLKKIKEITSRGNHAEVRQKADGTLTVYEVKKKIV